VDHKEYYKVMGVASTATDKEIKHAYRRLARKYHPDISKETNAEEHFKEVGEAYEVLKDPEKRKVYDQYLRDRERPHQARSSSHRQTTGGSYDESSMGYDFFESLFGAPPFRQQEETGQDVSGTIQISLEEAFHGAVKDIHLSGQANPSAEQTLRVKIPPGVKSGQKIRLAGQGYAGHGGKRGNLYITLQVNKHPMFDVMGDDIYVTVPVTPWEVALGSTIPVPTLAGNVDLKIPPGSQGGQTMRLKHRGLPGTTPGNQYVILKLVTPKPTTEAGRELYRKMAEEMPINPRESRGG
jgi:curved DNA-binding protein